MGQWLDVKAKNICLQVATQIFSRSAVTISCYYQSALHVQWTDEVSPVTCWKVSSFIKKTKPQGVGGAEEREPLLQQAVAAMLAAETVDHWKGKGGKAS